MDHNLQKILLAAGGGLAAGLALSALLKKKAPRGKFKVCVVGGAGGIGQPLCLLMATNPLVGELVVIDLDIAAVPAEGVQADLSHIEGQCKVSSLTLALNKDKLIDKGAEVLKGCDLVLVPAGVPRKPGQDRKDLLNTNAGIAKGTVEAVAKHCPKAVCGLIVNPVNSVVPAMCEMWKKKGLDPRKILGISTLDVVRANKFVQEITGMRCEIPVIGGHAGTTILPLFSQHPGSFSRIPPNSIPALDSRVQDAGTEVVKAKSGKGSATLSMAYAGARLANAVLSGLAGVRAEECAYVEAKSIGHLYFSTKVTFGTEGVERVHPIGALSPHEHKRLLEMTPILKEEIAAGLEYAKTNSFA